MTAGDRLPDVEAARAALGAALGTTLDEDLLRRALVHRSWAYENGGAPTNERLEFLGDSVLGLVVTEALYRRHPDEPEGRLAKIRAAVVNMRALAGLARGLGLGDHLMLGRGELATGGRDKDSILADALEALIGAVFLAEGLEPTREVLHRLLDDLLAASAERGAGLDWKTSLQEVTAARGLGVPSYLVEQSGPDHQRSFVARVVLADGIARGRGEGRTKKEAEQRAAEATWAELAAPEDADAARPQVTDASASAGGD